MAGVWSADAYENVVLRREMGTDVTFPLATVLPPNDYVDARCRIQRKETETYRGQGKE
jgi:hypothetical protein